MGSIKKWGKGIHKGLSMLLSAMSMGLHTWNAVGNGGEKGGNGGEKVGNGGGEEWEWRRRRVGMGGTHWLQMGWDKGGRGGL